MSVLDAIMDKCLDMGVRRLYTFNLLNSSQVHDNRKR